MGEVARLTVYFMPGFHTGTDKRGALGRPAQVSGPLEAFTVVTTGIECTIDGVSMLVPWHNIMRVERG